MRKYRLDKRTSGLILVMNDGDLAFQLLKPGNCPKEYICTVGRIPTEKQTKVIEFRTISTLFSNF